MRVFGTPVGRFGAKKNCKHITCSLIAYQCGEEDSNLRIVRQQIYPESSGPQLAGLVQKKTASILLAV